MNQKSFSTLVVDDEVDDVFLLKRALQNAGSRLHVIGDVRTCVEAIDYLSGQGHFSDRTRHPFPDILVLDLRMSGKDGFHILEWVKERKDMALKVIVLTGSLLDADRERALQLGAAYYHLKPMRDVTWAKLASALEKDLFHRTSNLPDP